MNKTRVFTTGAMSILCCWNRLFSYKTKECLSAVGDDASELSGAETDRYGTLYNRILREPRPAINACDEQCLCAKGFNIQVQCVCCRLYDSDGEA